jgi:hypothetical protein
MVVPHIATRRSAPRALLIPALILLAGLGTGCQSSKPVTNSRLIEHQAMIDFSGLAPVTLDEKTNVACSIPHNWQTVATKENLVYAHSQWKSPSAHTGVGVVHVKLPLLLSDSTVLWLAKREYTNKANDGREIREWTDELGRSWFEAENNKYHIQGYVLTRGFSAWLVYFGYKTGFAPDLAELSIAARSAETFVPDPEEGTVPAPATVAGASAD